MIHSGRARIQQIDGLRQWRPYLKTPMFLFLAAFSGVKAKLGGARAEM
jgi:hypothetical protein